MFENDHLVARRIGRLAQFGDRVDRVRLASIPGTDVFLLEEGGFRRVLKDCLKSTFIMAVTRVPDTGLGVPEISDKLANSSVAITDRITKIIVSVPGYYELANRYDAFGNRRKFACRVIGFSPEEITLFAPVDGAIGERVLTYSAEFGNLQGRISRKFDRGFAVNLAGTPEDRARRMEKLENYEMIKNHEVIDRRANKRIIPKSPHSTLVLADGSQIGCFVINISVSGAAVCADLEPAIGTPLSVGTMVGIVVRHLADGFAIRFIETHDLDDLEQKLILPKY